MPSSSVGSLHTSLLSAMLGASIGFAIQSGLQEPSTWTFVAIVALVLHVVNFYHGKSVALHDVNENIRADARPLVRGTLLLHNTLLFLAFCIMAARIESAYYIIWGVVAIRVLDITGVGAQLRWGDRSPGSHGVPPEVRRQLYYWQTMNVFALVVFASLAVVLASYGEASRYHVVVLTFAAMTVVDLILDYSMYSGNYFRRVSDWNALAERWDRLQGRYGDPARQSVLHPFVTAWVGELAAGRLVDLGCGNGCTARWLAEQAPAAVLGLDNSSHLIDIARLYRAERGSVEYLVHAIDAPDSRALRSDIDRFRGQGSLTFYSLFAAQDCVDAERFFQNLSKVMRAGERLLTVFEVGSSFDPAEKHRSTIRTWKYGWGRRERLQVVSWLPVTATNPTSLYADHGPDSDDIIPTVTRYREYDDYRGYADGAGLVELRSGVVPLTSGPATPFELDYSRKPKFGFIEFAMGSPEVACRDDGTDVRELEPSVQTAPRSEAVAVADQQGLE